MSLKLSDLSAIAASTVANDDLLLCDDISAPESKKLTIDEARNVFMRGRANQRKYIYKTSTPTAAGHLQLVDDNTLKIYVTDSFGDSAVPIAALTRTIYVSSWRDTSKTMLFHVASIALVGSVYTYTGFKRFLTSAFSLNDPLYVLLSSEESFLNFDPDSFSDIFDSSGRTIAFKANYYKLIEDAPSDGSAGSAGSDGSAGSTDTGNNGVDASVGGCLGGVGGTAGSSDGGVAGTVGDGGVKGISTVSSLSTVDGSIILVRSVPGNGADGGNSGNGGAGGLSNGGAGGDAWDDAISTCHGGGKGGDAANSSGGVGGNGGLGGNGGNNNIDFSNLKSGFIVLDIQASDGGVGGDGVVGGDGGDASGANGDNATIVGNGAPGADGVDSVGSVGSDGAAGTSADDSNFTVVADSKAVAAIVHLEESADATIGGKGSFLSGFATGGSSSLESSGNGSAVFGVASDDSAHAATAEGSSVLGKNNVASAVAATGLGCFARADIPNFVTIGSGDPSSQSQLHQGILSAFFGNTVGGYVDVLIPSDKTFVITGIVTTADAQTHVTGTWKVESLIKNLSGTATIVFQTFTSLSNPGSFTAPTISLSGTTIRFNVNYTTDDRFFSCSLQIHETRNF